MTRRAIVAAIGERWIDVLSLDETERAHDEKLASESCGSGSCGSGGCGCRVTGLPFRASNPRNLRLRSGDTVEVDAPAGKALGASLLVFGVPLALAAAGWLLASRLAPAAGGIGAAGAAAGLVLGGLAVSRLAPRDRSAGLPVITQVVEAP